MRQQLIRGVKKATSPRDRSQARCHVTAICLNQNLLSEHGIITSAANNLLEVISQLIEFSILCSSFLFLVYSSTMS